MQCGALMLAYPQLFAGGRPQRWASGRQRGLWPADNESRGKHPVPPQPRWDLKNEPLEEEDPRREEAEWSAVATDTPDQIDAERAGGNR